MKGLLQMKFADLRGHDARRRLLQLVGSLAVITLQTLKHFLQESTEFHVLCQDLLICVFPSFLLA